MGASVGAVSVVESGGELDVGVVVVLVGGVADVVVVDGLVVAGPLPPLPRASSSRPQMITATRVMTSAPHTASTHRRRYHGLGSSAGSEGRSRLPPKSGRLRSSGVPATARFYRGAAQKGSDKIRPARSLAEG